MNSIVFKSIFNTVTDLPQEASELETRSDLMISIWDFINDRECTQKEVAENVQREKGLTDGS